MKPRLEPCCGTMVEKIITADALEGLAQLKSGSVDMCVTSPPYYGLRDYGHPGQIGLEHSPKEYIERLVSVFREVRRVLRDDGTLWLNIGDSYAGSGKGAGGNKATAKETYVPAKNAPQCKMPKTHDGVKVKDLIGIPWMLAFALRNDGWYLRSDIVWSKPNPMPESVKDRPTRAHEYIFLLSKSKKYYYDHEAVKEPAVSTNIKKFTDNEKNKQRGHGRRHAGFNGRYAKKLAVEGIPETRNRRSVWSVATKPYNGAHFAVFPPELIRPCVLAGSRIGGTVLDPFFGAGTTGLVATEEQRGYIGIEINPEYFALARQRLDEQIVQMPL